jgi:hypothetical protein
MDLLPNSESQFHTKDYWDKFFIKRKQAFEWYGEYPQFKGLLANYLKQYTSNPNILTIGCGNSAMSSQMYDDGFQSIINIDFSEVVISEMKLKNTRR